MREIKFRAWDKENRIMSMVRHMNFYSLNGGADVDLTVDSDEEEWLTEPDFELMQYTGLKDKNGKEIYEGDIVLVPNTPTMSDPMGEPSFCPIVHESGSFGYLQGFMFESFIGLYGHGCTQADEEEVIGNIYENPELLEGNHD